MWDRYYNSITTIANKPLLPTISWEDQSALKRFAQYQKWKRWLKNKSSQLIVGESSVFTIFDIGNMIHSIKKVEQIWKTFILRQNDHLWLHHLYHNHHVPAKTVRAWKLGLPEYSTGSICNFDFFNWLCHFWKRANLFKADCSSQFTVGRSGLFAIILLYIEKEKERKKERESERERGREAETEDADETFSPRKL